MVQPLHALTFGRRHYIVTGKLRAFIEKGAKGTFKTIKVITQTYDIICI